MKILLINPDKFYRHVKENHSKEVLTIYKTGKYIFGITPQLALLTHKHSQGLSLDVGCGIEIYHRFFKGEVIGIDIIPELIKEAKRLNPKSYFLVGDIRKGLPFENKKFDFTLCSEVIEHLKPSENQELLRELDRVTKGTIIITTPNVDFFTKTLIKLFPSLFLKQDEVAKSIKNSIHFVHKDTWDSKRLGKQGYEVYGCLGWVTYYRFSKNKIIHLLLQIYDKFIWHFPFFAGTLIGIKKIKQSL